jgi:hypothetical protein
VSWRASLAARGRWMMGGEDGAEGRGGEGGEKVSEGICVGLEGAKVGERARAARRSHGVLGVSGGHATSAVMFILQRFRRS